jgi:catechol 2,3-dioxygenase-like lactoylglutathione lyase family enzyme
VLDGSELVAFVGSRDLEESNGFYAGILGLKRVEATSFANLYDVDGTMLRVTEVETVARAPYTVLGWNVANIQASVDVLAASGLVFKRYEGMDQDDAGVWTAPGGARIVWFEDPDGNTLSLSQLPAG